MMGDGGIHECSYTQNRVQRDLAAEFEGCDNRSSAAGEQIPVARTGRPLGQV